MGDPHHIVKVASNNLPEETFHFSNRKWLERKSKPLLGSDSLHALDSAPGRAASSNKRQPAYLAVLLHQQMVEVVAELLTTLNVVFWKSLLPPRHETGTTSHIRG